MRGSGLSAEELAGLESFGLIEAMTVAGLRTYDEDALTVANLAAVPGLRDRAAPSAPVPQRGRP